MEGRKEGDKELEEGKTRRLKESEMRIYEEKKRQEMNRRNEIRIRNEV